jgi:pilus assembly protein Flp/PilA
MKMLKTVLDRLNALRLLDKESGQGMVEYSLILALVSVVAIGTMTTLGSNVKSIFTSTSTALSTTTGS